MRQRKLQVFLSSTYTDLIDERLAAMEAILAAGHIPAAMEQFAPGDEESWTIIKRWIDESDAYILILGGRYGSIEPESGKSYVEREYDYALSQNKPFMSIVVTDEAHKRRMQEKDPYIVDEREHQAKLKVFKELVTKKQCAFWDDVKDIKARIFQKLPKWQARPELQGWIRAEEAASPEALNELARLSKENSELREKLSASRAEFNGLRFEELVKILSEDKNRNFLANPESLTKTSGELQKKIALHTPKNVGHLFELTMQELARGEVGFVSVRIYSEDKSEVIELAYDTSSLVEYGLSDRQPHVYDQFTSTTYLNLTEVGMRFKNSLLTYGALAIRLKELWNVETDILVSN